MFKLKFVSIWGWNLKMTNLFNNNSNPSGYDTKYCGSYLSFDNSYIDYEYNVIKTELKTQYKEQSDNKEQAKQNNTEQIDSISTLKINYIIEVIKRKLNILHRIAKKRILKKRVLDAQLIEREIEKRATLTISDMLTLLKIANKNQTMTTQQRVVLLSDINKNAKLIVDEKIIIVNKLIAMDIIKDAPSKKHMANKLTLLYIVKKSGFSIDVTRVKGYKPVMQSAEEESVCVENNSDVSEKVQEDTLQAELTKTDTIDEEASDNSKSEVPEENLTNSKSSGSITNKIADKKELPSIKKKTVKIPAITKTFVHSKRHFKFGAGYIAKNESVSLLLPSGYVLDSDNKAYQANRLRTDNKTTGDNANVANSPLYITFIKNNKSSDYSLLDFFNSNIIECKENNLKYRQTVISQSASVLKHKSGDNIYTASVFIEKMNYVYDIQFKFKKTVANTASTVNRILASIKFEGM